MKIDFMILVQQKRMLMLIFFFIIYLKYSTNSSLKKRNVSLIDIFEFRIFFLFLNIFQCACKNFIYSPMSKRSFDVNETSIDVMLEISILSIEYTKFPTFSIVSEYSTSGNSKWQPRMRYTYFPFRQFYIIEFDFCTRGSRFENSKRKEIVILH